MYYENGQLKYKWNFKDGKQYGEQLHYHENGQLKITDIWKDDKLIEKIKP